MSMYGDYIQERLGKSIVENEHGFATFKVTGDICYIEDIYVKPYSRQKNVASQMADEIAEYAKKMGCKHLVGSVDPLANGSTTSLRVLLGYGMKLEGSLKNNLIWFYKEI